MLSNKEIVILVCVFGTTALVAIAVWRYWPRLWWASVGVLTSGAGILLYLPIRIAFHAPSGFDSIGDGFGIVFEFMMIGGFLAIVHIASLAAMGLLIVETLLERRKSRVSNEVSSDN